MIKKIQVVAAASSLLLVLGACNYDNNAANDRRGDNLNDAFTTRNGNDTAEGLNTANTRNNITTDRVNYRVNDWDGLGYDNNRNNDLNGGVGHRDYDLNVGFNNNNRNTKNGLGGNMNDNISADFTTINSGKYPHTRAVQIQPAKYGYIIFSPQQGNAQKFQFTVPNAAQRYTQQFQTGTVQPGLTQQQPRPQMQQPSMQQPQQNQVTGQQKPVQQTQPKQQTQTTQPKPAAQTTQGISATEQKVIELTNVERRKNGLRDLIGDSKLSSVARTKSNDMQAKGYFSHTSPTYGSPFDMMRDFGVSYKTAGENIAQGQRTPEEVVRAWMNSEGHRKNILNGSFTHIGVGHNTTGNQWTQMFIGK
ncbi:CAP domain-containing protein [Bacillus sp. CGMCC 1.16607]|uniref:CAP domain-containing protein n=1 Tax=Bacillus sp. CGMCC 1.16607 TaxID=3351842 RepID=UPI00362C9728